MKSGLKTSTRKSKWTTQGEPLILSEFKQGIKKAERGPFFSIEKAKEMMVQWKKQENSK
jgi:predicted transcriptional regulator